MRKGTVPGDMFNSFPRMLDMLMRSLGIEAVKFAVRRRFEDEQRLFLRGL